MKTLIFSENGLTISGHVTVLRQWLSEKNTDYIINTFIVITLVNIIVNSFLGLFSRKKGTTTSEQTSGPITILDSRIKLFRIFFSVVIFYIYRLFYPNRRTITVCAL